MLLTGKKSFKAYVSEEIDLVDASLSFEIKNYLSELLYFYLFSERLFECKTENGNSYENALVDLYKKICEADSQEKIHLFKKMGDLSLYTSGFFRMAIEKRIVHVSYYESMGQSAYSYLGDYYKDRDNIFNTLSEQFRTLAEILFHIQQKSEAKVDENYLTISKKDTSSLEKILEGITLSEDEEG